MTGSGARLTSLCRPHDAGHTRQMLVSKTDIGCRESGGRDLAIHPRQPTGTPAAKKFELLCGHRVVVGSGWTGQVIAKTGDLAFQAAYGRARHRAMNGDKTPAEIRRLTASGLTPRRCAASAIGIAGASTDSALAMVMWNRFPFLP